MSWQDSVTAVAVVGISVSLSDDLNGWSDSVSAQPMKNLGASLTDSLNQWSDSLAVSLPGTHYGYATLLYSTALMEGRSGWFLDTFSPTVLVHYGDEGKSITDVIVGDSDGNVYLFEGDNDNGNPIVCNVRTASIEQGDLRYNKLYGDVMLDCNTKGVDTYATVGFDEFSWSVPPVTINEAARDIVPVTLGSKWRIAKNVALDLTWNHNGSSKEYFYTWEPRYTEEGGRVSAYTWDTSYLTHGYNGFFYHGYLYLVHISTANLTFAILNEDNTPAATVTVTHSSGLHVKDFIRLPVLKGKGFKYTLSSSAEFKVEGSESELLVKQWGIGGPWDRRRIFHDVPMGEAA